MEARRADALASPSPAAERNAPPPRDPPDGPTAHARRFADVLRRAGEALRHRPSRRDGEDPPPQALSPGAQRAAAEAPVRGAADAPPGPPARDGPAMPAAALADVELAHGAEGAALSFRLDGGSLDGLRVAFLLRGEALDLRFEAPGEEMQARVRALEDDVREALAERGIAVGRYDADASRGDERPAGDPEPSGGRGAAAGRRAAGSAPAPGGPRDYVR